MNGSLQIVTVIILLALTLIAARFLLGWQVKRARDSIIKTLSDAEAFDAERAIELNYHKPFWQRFGLRDYRPYVLSGMMRAGQIIQTSDGRHYLVRSKLQE